MAVNMIIKSWCCTWAVAAWWCMVAAGDCDVTVDGRSYTKELLVSGVKYPCGLGMDYNTNTLYFSFFNLSWHSAKLELENKTFTLLKGLSGECSFAVDQMRGYVHAGCRSTGDGTNGLYQLDNNTVRFKLAGEAGHDVLSVQYYNNTLYYSSFDKEILKTFINGQGSPVSDFYDSVWHFVIDSRGDIVYSNLGGLRRLRRDDDKLILYKDFVEAVLAMDTRGAVYACDDTVTRGIWRLPEHERYATRLLEVDCRGLTFDAQGNIIYAEYNYIVRLLPC